MQNKTLFYILMIFVIVFLIIDVISIFNRKPSFQVVSYFTKIETDYSENATLTTTANLLFKDEKSMKSYISNYQLAASNTFIDYFNKISKEIGKTLKVIDYKNSINERAGILEIEEVAYINNLVTKKGTFFELGMGALKLNAAENSEFAIYLPENATVVLIDPTPTSIMKNKITWKGTALNRFPTIRYRRAE
ncbi:DUF4897 domain-containing protein [Thermosipho ferrireducens]|uniref:DUF4897 domain-containing protein n=1 Tax=Thermosipho ferrireducens TaxID=2571116 RepID=A0ABX7S6Y6_9BACT|nr:DUF4897 domain-containing protein [Thermosipho ferrireducens]QTA38353.1 DUF4897 domain-containing protein [Thermosipho ferrireducens]